MINQIIREAIQGIAANQTGIAQFRATLRGEIPAMFPSPTVADIAAVKKGAEFRELIDFAREQFVAGYFAAPREYKDGSAVDLDAVRAALDETDTAKLSDDQKKLRDLPKAYARTAIRQNITAYIPAALDAPEKTGGEGEGGDGEGETGDTAVDITATLGNFTAALIALSETDTAGAKVLLNAADEWLKYARPFIIKGEAIPRKAA